MIWRKTGVKKPQLTEAEAPTAAQAQLLVGQPDS